jgi:predicted membrane-bound dolichyl-phosphate-mannose-protein mannosyltransferase
VGDCFVMPGKKEKKDIDPFYNGENNTLFDYVMVLMMCFVPDQH